jgi:hypothetical protein
MMMTRHRKNARVSRGFFVIDMKSSFSGHSEIKMPNKADHATPSKPSDHFVLHPGAHVL